ncbi:hypothetical protein NL676_005749 [Syzygium grande]|nr:hypothetical protein NL676_005749 [Syzygium grande]
MYDVFFFFSSECRDAMRQLNEGIIQYMAAFSIDTTRFSEATVEPFLSRLTLEWVRAWERGLVRTASVTFLDTLSEDRNGFVRWVLGVRIWNYLRRLGFEDEAQQFLERAVNEPIEGVDFIVIWICSVGQTLLADRDRVSSLGDGTEVPPA